MKTIGIIGAMPSELADIRNVLTDYKIIEKAKYEFYVAQYKGKTIVSVCCGVAKVNASVGTQVLIDEFHPDAIINTGIAGGMNTSVKVCDIVVTNEVMHHDVTTRFLNNYPPYCSCFVCDEKLINTATEACKEFGINTHIGKIVSGEQFISDNEVKAKIVEEFSPLAVDMESAAIAHCCMRNAMPFAIVRCISDNADDEGEMSFDRFEKIAAKRNADVVMRTIEKL